MKIITICAAAGLAVASMASIADAAVQQGYGQRDYGNRGDDRGALSNQKHPMVSRAG